MIHSIRDASRLKRCFYYYKANFAIRKYWSTEAILFLSSIFFTLLCNSLFWSELFNSNTLTSFHTLKLMLFTAISITGFQWFLLLLIAYRWILKGLMSFLFITTSIVVYFMTTFHIYIDNTMIENVLSTDYLEAKDLFHWQIILYMLILGVLPSLIICNIKFNRRQWLSSLVRRAISIVLSLTMVAVGIWSIFFDLGPIFHERKELTYLITPFNYLISSADAYRRHHMITTQKIPLGNDAHIPKQPHAKPRLILLVVGETVRASNWGLNGYTRQTTPELAKRQVFNFNQVSSCGTTTAISLPCMFSPYGFHSYNQRLINQSESLLHVLWHAKVSVLWRDNQSGCKNVCTNLPYEIPNSEAFCKNGKCFDEVLLHQLKDKIDIQKNNQLIVLHMIGNHGPAYFERYPPQFNHWQPTCDTSDLANCTKESIVNTYDNVILYTDHILSNLIDILLTIQSHDTGLIYLSDHGESLGENNLVLHGLPYFIAPKEQKNIPLMIWLSNGLTKQLDLQKNCLSKKLSDQISHDYLFSTVLALFNVKTTVYDPKYDLIHSCQITKNTTNPLTQEVL